jgi:hypothetical protein
MKEAMKLALEALKSISEMFDYEGNGFKLEYEIKALEEALAKQEQGEPFGYWFSDDPDVVAYAGSDFFKGSKPPNDAVNIIPLYTTPQQRTWVGLTDEEIKAINAQVSQIPPIDYTTTTYAKAVEAKLKEKNT